MKRTALLLAALLPCLAAPTDVDKGKVLGGLGAPIVIEVYSSFACTHCRDFHEQILPQLVRDYVLPGKVCIISRELFPRNYAVALEAAEIATAAARIGKYSQVSDALFRTQAAWVPTGKIWESLAGVLTPEQQKQVQSLAKDKGVVAEVQRDIDLGTAAGAVNTPTLMITRGNKRYPYSGVPEYSLFRSLLDNLLAQ